jgi:major membrane immunogen (membrane-anchored lipoprotein)
MNRTVKAITAAAALAVSLLLTGCGANDFTGTATLVEHHQNGRHCHVTLSVEGQGEKGMSIGSYGRCDNLTDGTVVTLKDGYIVK